MMRAHWSTTELSRGIIRMSWVLAICGATLLAFIVCPVFLPSRVDWNMPADQTVNKMQNLAKIMIALRDRGYDLRTVSNTDGLLNAAVGARLITDVDRGELNNDGWKTPFVWRVSKSATGAASASIFSCGMNRAFDGGSGDDIAYELSLSGRERGTLRYDSIAKTDWPPTPQTQK